jgi:hypothetical protein
VDFAVQPRDYSDLPADGQIIEAGRQSGDSDIDVAGDGGDSDSLAGFEVDKIDCKTLCSEIVSIPRNIDGARCPNLEDAYFHHLSARGAGGDEYRKDERAGPPAIHGT